MKPIPIKSNTTNKSNTLTSSNQSAQGLRLKYEILDNVEIIDLALYFEKEKILIISDTHIGYEEALNKQGILVPKQQFYYMHKRLEAILKSVSHSGKLKQIIINGDVKHEFGTISNQEWKDAIRLFELLLKYSNDVALIKGNHDTIISPIAKKKGIMVIDSAIIDGILILHGHEIPKHIIKKRGAKEERKSGPIKGIIIGHEHPAVSLGERKEKYKCFLKGKWKEIPLIVMPSFFLATQGADIRNEKMLSPFLKSGKGMNDFEVFIIENKEGEIGRPGSVLGFGKVKGLP